jgi:hypothetical protein
MPVRFFQTIRINKILIFHTMVIKGFLAMDYKIAKKKVTNTVNYLRNKMHFTYEIQIT